MSGPTIRRAKVADAFTLHALAEETFPLACPPGTSADNIASFVTSVLSEEAFARSLADPHHTVFLAWLDGVAIGYAMAVAGTPDPVISSQLTHRPSLELSKLYVVAAHHGSSVAGALLAEVVDLATQLGMGSIWLGVNRENARANRFYERNGFTVVGHREFVVGVQVEQDWVREKPLVGPADTDQGFS